MFIMQYLHMMYEYVLTCVDTSFMFIHDGKNQNLLDRQSQYCMTNNQ
jgi:hypothetical protein